MGAMNFLMLGVMSVLHLISGAIDLSGVDFAPLVSAIEEAVPAVLGAIIPIVAIRKVISFIIGSIKGA